GARILDREVGEPLLHQVGELLPRVGVGDAHPNVAALTLGPVDLELGIGRFLLQVLDVAVERILQSLVDVDRHDQMRSALEIEADVHPLHGEVVLPELRQLRADRQILGPAYQRWDEVGNRDQDHPQDQEDPVEQAGIFHFALSFSLSLLFSSGWPDLVAVEFASPAIGERSTRMRTFGAISNFVTLSVSSTILP